MRTMDRWDWGFSRMTWREWLFFELAAIAHNECRIYHSEVFQGISIGLAIGALLFALFGRFVWPAGLMAMLVWLGFEAQPETPRAWHVIATHIECGLFALIPVGFALFRHRLQPGAPVQPIGH
jgi:hypothetical protein